MKPGQFIGLQRIIEIHLHWPSISLALLRYSNAALQAKAGPSLHAGRIQHRWDPQMAVRYMTRSVDPDVTSLTLPLVRAAYLRPFPAAVWPPEAVRPMDERAPNGSFSFPLPVAPTILREKIHFPGPHRYISSHSCRPTVRSPSAHISARRSSLL